MFRGSGLQPGSRPPGVPGWGCMPTHVNGEAVPSLLPSLSFALQPGSYGRRHVCSPGCYWPSGDFPADLHVALLALRAFLFTSLQSEGEPDCSNRHTGPTGAGGLAVVPGGGGVPAGVPAAWTMGAAGWSRQLASGPWGLAAEGADGL